MPLRTPDPIFFVECVNVVLKEACRGVLFALNMPLIVAPQLA